MKATLSDLARETSKVVRPVIHGGKSITLTDRGVACAQIVPVATAADRRTALELLRQIGPLELPARK